MAIWMELGNYFLVNLLRREASNHMLAREGTFFRRISCLDEKAPSIEWN